MVVIETATQEKFVVISHVENGEKVILELFQRDKKSRWSGNSLGEIILSTESLRRHL